MYTNLRKVVYTGILILVLLNYGPYFIIEILGGWWNTGILEYYNTWNIIPGIMKLLGFLNLDLLAINL